jgi:hypothetical protein
MFGFYNRCKKYFDYIPIFLISLFFLAEMDMEKHAVNHSFQLITVITVFITFYIIYYKTNTKLLALAVSAILWIVMVYLKKNVLFTEPKVV